MVASTRSALSIQPSRHRSPKRRTPVVSIVVTTHNEGVELRRTLASIRDNTRVPHEVIVVDDGSSDGSCSGIEDLCVRVLRHSERIGVAASRNQGARVASAETLCFLDAHQRLSPGCIDQCVEVAQQRESIVSPNVRGYGCLSATTYGAKFRLCPKNGYFSAIWKLRRPRCRVTQSTTLRAPGYVMPRSIYERVYWSSHLRGWGASEAAVAVKAFFQGIDILQLHGPVARHRFRRKFPYRTSWESVWLNHGIVARVCFERRTWEDYWLPEVFAKNLSPLSLCILESSPIDSEHTTFQRTKVREDSSFWTELLGVAAPVRAAKARAFGQQVQQRLVR